MSASWPLARRPRNRRRAGAGLLALALSAALHATPLAAAEPEADELARTWQAARLYLPDATTERSLRIEEAGEAPPRAGTQRLPTIIYMHGCAGINYVAAETAEFLRSAGYAVIMPDSFARRDKPVSCDPLTLKAGLHRAVLGWRQAEARYAVERARALPWVDGQRLYLMGLSEGGITVATVFGVDVRARIIEGWTCHAGWPEYHGLAAPEGEPVLALLGADDPWFRLPVLKGDCGAFMSRTNGSESMVYRVPHPLANQHYLIWHEDARRRVLDFLAAPMPPAGETK